MKLPTTSALLLPLTGLLLTSSTPAAAGPVVAGLCATGCISSAAACHGIGHSTFSLFSGGLLIAPTILVCHGTYLACMSGCAAVVVAPVP